MIASKDMEHDLLTLENFILIQKYTKMKIHLTNFMSINSNMGKISIIIVKYGYVLEI